MRFDPPPITQPPELDWLLGAAFGPALPPLAGDPAVAGELAGKFDLGSRIVARHGAAAIEKLLGDAASGPIRSHRRGVAIALAGDRAARRLAGLAERHALPIILLKGYALGLMLAGPAGWRPYADLDVLLDRPAGERLRELLVADGWVSSAEAGNPQHLPPIAAPTGTMVDIHYRLRGIRVAAARWATADELLRAGLCRPAGLGAASWLPAPALMAAHLAVHALEQHGHRPATYPLLRAVADLADLAAAHPGEELESRAAALIGDILAADETRAIFSLAGRLAAGRAMTRDDGDDRGSAILLRHIVAGALDRAYRQGLALDHTAGRLRQARRDGKLMRYITGKLKAQGAPLETAGEGSARHPGPWRRRLLHPIRLCTRFAIAAAARLRRAIDR